MIACPTPACDAQGFDSVGELAAHLWEEDSVLGGAALWAAREAFGFPYAPVEEYVPPPAALEPRAMLAAPSGRAPGQPHRVPVGQVRTIRGRVEPPATLVAPARVRIPPPCKFCLRAFPEKCKRHGGRPAEQRFLERKRIRCRLCARVKPLTCKIHGGPAAAERRPTSKPHAADPASCRICARFAPEKCKRHGGPSRSTSFSGKYSTVNTIKTAAKRVGTTVTDYEQRVAAGQKWCYLCARWQPVADFGIDRRRYDGLTAACRTAKNTQERALYLTRDHRVAGPP